MLRQFYICLLRAHPPAFRDRFGHEMLAIFDFVAGSGMGSRLILDGLVSLFRQWILRSEFHRQPLATDAALFRTIAPQGTRPFAMLLQGCLLSAVLLFGAGKLMGVGGRVGSLLIGSDHPGPHLVPINRDSFADVRPGTTVHLGPGREDPWRNLAVAYFKRIRVLDALDADQDYNLSPWEIFTAPAALRRLDSNHDGALSAEECGLWLGVNANTTAAHLEQARRSFMRAHPVLSALDANNDGVISRSEILNAPSALRSLDRNGDGVLSPGELIPGREGVVK